MKLVAFPRNRFALTVKCITTQLLQWAIQCNLFNECTHNQIRGIRDLLEALGGPRSLLREPVILPIIPFGENI